MGPERALHPPVTPKTQVDEVRPSLVLDRQAENGAVPGHPQPCDSPRRPLARAVTQMSSKHALMPGYLHIEGIM